MMNSEEMSNRGFEMTEKTMASFLDTWSLVLGSMDLVVGLFINWGAWYLPVT